MNRPYTPGSPVVAGVDGSPLAERALDLAADTAAMREAELHIVHAVSGAKLRRAGQDPEQAETAARVPAVDLLAAYADRARERCPGLVVTTELVTEGPVAGLVERSERAALVVVGSRGMNRFASLVLGSVSQALVAHARCPVTVVRPTPDGGAAPEQGPVVVGVASDEDAAPVEFAFAEAERRGAPVHAIRTWMAPQVYPGHMAVPPDEEAERNLREAEELEAALAAARKAYPEVPVATAVGLDEPEAALVAASEPAGLVVVGARRHRGVLALPLGRVTSRVLHHAHCPVVVVPV
ncbi:universal stress protein [Streptacidiphilus sp. PB12-B1b]|uniref:universal stress protein n=1 Tax=Streptacidiphilus sp. PB12-B1b TaxID=2705012 RepID=UPI0015F8161A|nr:universal stress protein [Streptacidiphilus sp. PB12-B1b]QMU77037.1 universal stress protein [Streptacidiphilus sp. PB12-B1b]